MQDQPQTGSPQQKQRPWMDLLISIIIPSVILMKLSNDAYLGAAMALVVALAFPLLWGLYELVKFGKKNFIAVLGLISIALTGGIGLLKLDAQWLAIKEAAVPAVIALAVLISTKTRYPLVRTLLYNRSILNVDKIHDTLAANGHEKIFEKRLLIASYLFACTFIFSSVMNYLLAKWIVTSASGSAAFNEELGQMTLVSYPVIAIPSMIMMIAIFYYLWRAIRNLTGFKLEEVLSPALAPDHEESSEGNESSKPR